MWRVCQTNKRNTPQMTKIFHKFKHIFYKLQDCSVHRKIRTSVLSHKSFETDLPMAINECTRTGEKKPTMENTHRKICTCWHIMSGWAGSYDAYGMLLHKLPHFLHMYIGTTFVIKCLHESLYFAYMHTICIGVAGVFLCVHIVAFL